MEEIITEDGVLDIIHEYVCGIKYRKLSKIVRKHFEIFAKTESEKMYKNVTEYFYDILSKAQENPNNQFHVRIKLRELSRIITNKNRSTLGMRLLYKYSHEHSLFNAIDNVLKEIGKINNNTYTLLYYANK